jgi:hypothetical protein
MIKYKLFVTLLVAVFGLRAAEAGLDPSPSRFHWPAGVSVHTVSGAKTGFLDRMMQKWSWMAPSQHPYVYAGVGMMLSGFIGYWLGYYRHAAVSRGVNKPVERSECADTATRCDSISMCSDSGSDISASQDPADWFKNVSQVDEFVKGLTLGQASDLYRAVPGYVNCADMAYTDEDKRLDELGTTSSMFSFQVETIAGEFDKIVKRQRIVEVANQTRQGILALNYVMLWARKYGKTDIATDCQQKLLAWAIYVAQVSAPNMLRQPLPEFNGFIQNIGKMSAMTKWWVDSQKEGRPYLLNTDKINTDRVYELDRQVGDGIYILKADHWVQPDPNKFDFISNSQNNSPWLWKLVPTDGN